MLLFTVPVTSNASRHFKSPLAMGEMPFKIKRASSVPISVVIDTGVNSKKNVLWYILFFVVGLEKTRVMWYSHYYMEETLWY